MPLFQESIVKKHLGLIEKDHIDAAYEVFKRVYSAEKIKNIRTAKEEQYQEGFIKDVFGAVLGYSVFPESPFNIQTEKKNESDAKKADGAIFRDDKVVGVIELKDNTTKNLDSVKDQAFGYKHSHKECSYVISSNFHKLRFYIDDATDYEEFDLYNLDKETFKRFYLYLRKEGLLDKNLPKLLREETKFHEEEISKKLYKDYSSFKRRFFENAVKNNPQQDKLLLFRKSQKFLDRILFLLFAEDKGLVGTNSVVKIVEKWSEADEDYYRPLYEMVNTYFMHLYRGFTYQKTGEVIPQFGGELFAPDEVLESLTIDDTVLKNDLLILSKYDFNTDVDVNILGHIFEHSLNEVDDVEAELRGETLDKSKSKRKKDGVFYTPNYITKYIVDNTLGKLCAEKKTELGLDRDLAIFDYQKADGKLNEKGKDLYERLNAYSAWLLTLKVCDPACGSGAFLNQALSFFIDEHRFVDDLIAELLNTPLRLFDTDLQILENNIYGVDINDESIEIAKLSLWLRTAQPGRKLSDLSRNIRCGNSLIDDPAVAGDKAFNWQHAFPDVFAKGGFDVVIGNPPYGAKLSEIDKIHLRANYPELQFKIDTYSVFVLKLFQLLKPNGHGYYIIPNTLLDNYFEEKVRAKIIEDSILLEIIDLDDKVFPGAVVHSMILGIRKTQEVKNIIYNVKIGTSNQLYDLGEKIPIDFFQNQEKFCFSIRNFKNKDILEKLSIGSIKLKEILDIRQTIKTGNDSEHISTIKKADNYKPILAGKDIQKWQINSPELYVNYGKHLACPRDPLIFEQPKILIREAGDKITATYDENNYYIMSSLYAGISLNTSFSLKYILALLNSALFQFQLKLIAFDKTQGAFTKARIFHYYELPIKVIDAEHQINFIFLADKMISLNRDLRTITELNNQLISATFKIPISKKLQNWIELEFDEFLGEIEKARKETSKAHNSESKKLSLHDAAEWLNYFTEKKKKVLHLKTQIDQTDREIDRMVYALYGLTEEEIAIVEGS